MPVVKKRPATNAAHKEGKAPKQEAPANAKKKDAPAPSELKLLSKFKFLFKKEDYTCKTKGAVTTRAQKFAKGF